MNVNKIYDDTICKYTLNIPVVLYAKLTEHTRKGTRYGGHKSTYIREILERDLAEERIPNPEEFKRLSQGEVTRSSLKFRLWWSLHTLKNTILYNNEPAEAATPPKRFHGFIDGLQYWPLLRRWQRKQQAYREYIAKNP